MALAENASLTETCVRQFPSLVVGNKVDLVTKRKVSREEAQSWANKFEDCDYLEVSAKRATNVNELFQKLLHQILEAEKRKPEVEPEEEEPEEAPAAAQPASPPAGPAAVGKGKKDKKGECLVQ